MNFFDKLFLTLFMSVYVLFILVPRRHCSLTQYLHQREKKEKSSRIRSGFRVERTRSLFTTEETQRKIQSALRHIFHVGKKGCIKSFLSSVTIETEDVCVKQLEHSSYFDSVPHSDEE